MSDTGSDASHPAALRAGDLLHKAVYDHEGRLLGRVKGCREAEGILQGLEIELAPEARQALHVLQASAPLSPADVEVHGEDVSLRRSGEARLRPEDPHLGIGAREDV